MKILEQVNMAKCIVKGQGKHVGNALFRASGSDGSKPAVCVVVKVEAGKVNGLYLGWRDPDRSINLDCPWPLQ